MPKKLLIVAIIFFLLTLGVVGYLYFFQTSPTETTLLPNGENPFGTGGNVETIDKDRIENADGSVTIPVIALTHIYTDPIGGATIYLNNGVTNSRLVDRGTGSVFTFDFSSGVLTKTTNTTVPKVQESFWYTNGTNVVLRYISEENNTLSTYQAKLLLPTATSSSALGTFQGKFLPDNISSFSVSPSGKKVGYVITTGSGSQVVSSNSDGTKPVTLYSSSLSHWNVSWPQESTLALTSSAASNAPGFLYFLSTSGTLKKILGNIDGLTTLVDPTATLVAYSEKTQPLKLFDIKNNKTTVLSIETLPEKCIWSTKEKNILYCAVPTSIGTNALPEAWYEGTISFTDRIYKINTGTNIASVVGDLQSTFKQNIDAINLVLSPNEDYLLFTNKKDLSLWSLRINQ